jgi:hypothetical protein
MNNEKEEQKHDYFINKIHEILGKDYSQEIRPEGVSDNELKKRDIERVTNTYKTNTYNDEDFIENFEANTRRLRMADEESHTKDMRARVTKEDYQREILKKLGEGKVKYMEYTIDFSKITTLEDVIELLKIMSPTWQMREGISNPNIEALGLKGWLISKQIN